MVQMLGLSALGAVAGNWIKRRFRVLDRLNIPAPIVGGMVYALIALVLRDRVVNVEADDGLRNLLQIAFFTTIGLNVRMEMLRKGGAALAWLLAASSLGVVLQNAVGMVLARGMGIDPRIGILAGSVSLAGGPATSLVFGALFEKMGVQGATTVAVASATFGITVSGLIGGYIGGWLIKRHRLAPKRVKEAKSIAPVSVEAGSMMTSVAVVAISMFMGSLVSLGLQGIGVVLPSTIGAMIAALLVRAAIDRYRFVNLRQNDINEIAHISLHLFIVMALVTLKLWELAQLAVPMLVLLAAQVALCWLMCVTLAFWVMGRDYTAAVGAGGFCGFMLGITPNAVAVMDEVVAKHGPAPQAFLIVPVVGAFLVDFVNSLVVTAMANWVR